MRVRPFFWILLAAVCTGVLIFAANISTHKSIPLRAQIDQVSRVTSDTTLVRLRLTDPEGVPVDEASVIPRAYMLNMHMAPQQTRVQALGQGIYLAQIAFSMAGIWKIDIIAHANGFDTMKQSVQVQVYYSVRSATIGSSLAARCAG